VAEPVLDLGQAKRLMDALYQPGDTFYVLAYYDAENGRRPFQKRLTHDARWSAGSLITSADSDGMAVATSVGVFEPGEPDRPARRTEDQCAGLSAFGIDIDRDDLPALVPGATMVEEVIPEVVHRLEVAGIPPHALVRSGRGLHVYMHQPRPPTPHAEGGRAGRRPRACSAGRQGGWAEAEDHQEGDERGRDRSDTT